MHHEVSHKHADSRCGRKMQPVITAVRHSTLPVHLSNTVMSGCFIGERNAYPTKTVCYLVFLFFVFLVLVLSTGMEAGAWVAFGYFTQAVGLQTSDASVCAFLCSLTVVSAKPSWKTGADMISSNQTRKISLERAGVALVLLQ